MPKRRSPLAIDDAGRKLVLARSIMHPLIPFIDGLTCVIFKGEKTPYLPLDVAIGWLERESQVTLAKQKVLYDKILARLRGFRDAPADAEEIA